MGLDSDATDVLDLVARVAHTDTPAHDAHWEVAIHLWPQIRALGYTDGHMFAAGIDADLLAGRPRYPEPASHNDRSDDYVGFHAPIPPDGRWPHADLPMHDIGVTTPDLFDLIIANLPYTDTRFHSPANHDDTSTLAHRAISEALIDLRPGGLLVALANRLFLDGPDEQPRRSISRRADLLGAARIPAAALRAAPLADSPVDLLLLRRRESGAAPAGASFTSRVQATVYSPEAAYINEYYASRPKQAAGNITADPVDPRLTTVNRGPGHFGRRLRNALNQIPLDAQEAGLSAAVRDVRPTTAREHERRRAHGQRGPEALGP
jgi:hypothetical protein